MNSFELTKAKPPKHWFDPIRWGVLIFFIFIVVSSLTIRILFMKVAPSLEIYIISQLFTFIFLIITVFIINRFVNKRTVEALGFHREKWISKYLIGVLIGTILIGFTCGSAILLGALTVEFNNGVNWGFIILLLIGFMIQGMGEEVLSRGYIQNGIRVRWGIVMTMIIQGIFFTALHSLNPGMTLLPIINLFLYAVFIGVVFYYTDSLWIAGGIHSIWNFLLGPVLGIEVSGQAVPGSVFNATVHGAEYITGGSFGMEGSILTTIAMIVSTLVVYLLIGKKENV